MTGSETFCAVPFAFGRKSVKVRAIARHEKYLKEAINGVFMVFGPGSWNDERCGLKKLVQFTMISNNLQKRSAVRRMLRSEPACEEFHQRRKG
jgi:hypothetical protein